MSIAALGSSTSVDMSLFSLFVVGLCKFLGSLVLEVVVAFFFFFFVHCTIVDIMVANDSISYHVAYIVSETALH